MNKEESVRTKGGNNGATGRRKYNGNNSRRSKNNNDSSDCKDAGYSRVRNSDNDASWYALNPQLLKDAASINTTNVSGDPIRWNTSGQFSFGPWTSAVPGIFVLEWHPTVGTFSNISGPTVTGVTQNPNPTAAINLAAKNIYSFVRHKNSGAANYESPDLMMAIEAATNAFSAIALGIRAYGIAMYYNQKNRYTPQALLSAMGFDPNDVINNLANFRYGINSRIARSQVIWVPNNLSIVARRFWLNTNVYKDSESHKAQFYMFTPGSFYKFEPKTSSTGSSLSVQNWGAGTQHTVAQYFALVDSLLDPIISDEDMGIMFGDMLKAYGENNLFRITAIPDDYAVVPVHNKEVLYQIHNATSINIPNSVVKQDGNGNIYQEMMQGGRNTPQVSEAILNYWEENPTPETVMVSTRMHSLVGTLGYNGTGYVMYPLSGTEYVQRFRIFQYNAANALINNAIQTFDVGNNTDIYASILSKFDWAPVYLPTTFTQGATASADTWVADTLFQDLDNYTLTGPNTILKMHNTALLSEFGVPVE